MSLSANRPAHLADTTDIEQWAERIMARADLARLVRTLIRQTNDKVVTLEMRAGEGSEVSGCDGVVEATAASPFVPLGRSVWELGTGAVPTDKATDDYKLRTDDPLGEDQAQTTFVFVTPRRWKNKDEWIAKRQSSSPWKAIRVLDVDDIEIALEQAPGAHYILSDLLGKAGLGAQGIEEWWKRFSTGSNPSLIAEMVLAGRQESAATLLDLLEQDVRRTTISAASADDALAFVAATIMSAEEEQRMDLFGRALIVREAHALRVLEKTAKLLILLPYDEALQREAELVRSHHVVFLAPRDMPADVTPVAVHQPTFAALLVAAGVEETKSAALARAAARSLVAFQRQSAAAGSIPRPEWTAWLRTQTIRRAWLTGGWTTLRSGDVDVLTEILGQPYEELEGDLREAARGQDPLFTSVGDAWGVASPEATWDYARVLLVGSDFASLERAAQTVLGAVDPALELPADQRWAAAVHGKSRIHSSNIRDGLSTTLALLGALGETVDLGQGATARIWAERTVRRLLDRANADPTGQLWSSLSDVLPHLAEAAPDQFLHAVQNGCTGVDPVLAKLFTDTGEGFSISSPHTGLLWALELLAWSPEHLGLAADALARLVELDPGGRLSNRPSASLVGIFRPWLPQSAAEPDQRLRVLEAVADRFPEVAWRLLLRLLPERHGVGTYTHAPRFRDWRPKPAPVSVQEYWQIVGRVLDMLLGLAQAAPDRWPDLIRHLPDLPADSRAEVYLLLEEVAEA